MFIRTNGAKNGFISLTINAKQENIYFVGSEIPLSVPVFYFTSD